MDAPLSVTSLLAFIAVSAAVIATPGPDTALTVRNTLRGGRRAGLATAAGVAAGQLVWAAATSLGLAALLLRYEPLFLALQYAGAGWLMLLGARTLRQAARAGGPRTETAPSAEPGASAAPVASSAPVASAESGAPRAGHAFALGLLNDLTNPKMALYFASVLPQFAATGAEALPSFLLLGALFATMTLAWLTLYVLALSRLGSRWRGGRAARAAMAMAGLALAALGLRAALQAR
jgi:threonine/homoserine/homoserine lactone efflux protein